MSRITTAQRDALKSYAADFEAPDYAEYSDRAGAALGWLNRERVITALVRKGLLNGDLRITDAGRLALSSGVAPA